MDRHTRQIRLADVGEAGQARIGASVVDVPGNGLGAETAARYLAGAGVACVRVHDVAAGEAARAVDARVRVEVASGPTSQGLALAPGEWHDETARSLATGALHALEAIQGALRGGR